MAETDWDQATFEAHRPLLFSIAYRMLGSASEAEDVGSESDFELVSINGAAGLLLRHPISGNGTYSFDIADGRIRAIYVVRAHALSAQRRGQPDRVPVTDSQLENQTLTPNATRSTPFRSSAPRT